jgi:hypothetical protein
MTMHAKNSSTLHRCIELKKCPTDEVCHHVAPLSVGTRPDASTTSSAANVATPNT